MVSICIPTYNQTKYLTKLLDSIAAQTYKDLEVIISDDSSNEDVKQLIERFKEKFKISYHKNAPALGTPANWNKAVEISKGELIKIMHHDDWFDRDNSLDFFVSAMDKEKSDLVFCASKILDVRDNSLRFNSPPDEFVQELSNDPMVLFNNNKIGAPSAILFKRSLFEPFDTKMKYLVDIDFYIRLIRKAKGISFVKVPLIVNTSHNEEQVTAKSLDKYTQIGEYCYLYSKHFKGVAPDAKFKKFFKELFAWHGLKDFEEITSRGWPHPQPEKAFKKILFWSKLSKLFS